MKSNETEKEIRHKAITMVNSSLTNNLDNKFIRRVIN